MNKNKLAELGIFKDRQDGNAKKCVQEHRQQRDY